MFETLLLLDYLIIGFSLLLAYIIFGMVGFGTALIASPVLVLYLPVNQIIPLLALLDLCAAVINIYRDGRYAHWRELKKLALPMIIGSLIGATILLKTPAPYLLLALGSFFIFYSLYALSGLIPQRQFSVTAAIPFGLIGGIFSAMFGSGGVIYAIYLSGRLANKSALRMTQATLIGLTTLTRATIFALAGVYSNSHFFIFVLLMLPVMFLGITIGRQLNFKLSLTQFIKVIYLLLFASGIMLIVRYFY